MKTTEFMERQEVGRCQGAQSAKGRKQCAFDSCSLGDIRVCLAVLEGRALGGSRLPAGIKKQRSQFHTTKAAVNWRLGQLNKGG